MSKLITNTIRHTGASVDALTFDSDGNTLIADSEELRIGTGTDLKIYHNGSNSYLTNTTGNLIIDNSAGVDMYINSGNDIYIRPQGSDNGIKLIGDGAVELYYDNSKKFETIATGVNITGGIRLGGNNAANELDDYEEGTFSLTPNLVGASIDNNTFKYTKVGNTVHYSGRLHYDSASGTSDQILGLPFAVSDYVMSAPIYVDSGFSLGSEDYFMAYSSISGARLQMTTQITATGYNLPGAADIYISGFYYTNS